LSTLSDLAVRALIAARSRWPGAKVGDGYEPSPAEVRAYLQGCADEAARWRAMTVVCIHCGMVGRRCRCIGSTAKLTPEGP
jgi:hypothetical protein